MNRLLAEVTFIRPAIVNGTQPITDIPPEEICKWIQQRQTKKEEDLAYCLLGLLGISLIPHYGEGQRAWSRLEEEVSKKKRKVDNDNINSLYTKKDDSGKKRDADFMNRGFSMATKAR